MKSVLNALCSCFGYEVQRITRGHKNGGVPPDPFDAQRVLLTRAGISDPVVFDVGGHRGETTARYAEVFPSGSFHCFEPFPESFEKLQARFAGDRRVNLINRAVADRSGKSEFFVNTAASTNSLLPRPREARRYFPQYAAPKTKIDVTVTSLDDFIREQKIDRLDILKLDIQGAELLALHGSVNLLQSLRVPLIYTEAMFVPHYEGQPLFRDLWNFLAEQGYSVFDLYELRHATNGQLRFANALFVHGAMRRKVVDAFEAEP